MNLANGKLQNYKTKDYKTTKLQNYKTIKLPNYRTTKSQNYNTTKLQNSLPPRITSAFLLASAFLLGSPSHFLPKSIKIGASSGFWLGFPLHSLQKPQNLCLRQVLARFPFAFPPKTSKSAPPAGFDKVPLCISSRS